MKQSLFKIKLILPILLFSFVACGLLQNNSTVPPATQTTGFIIVTLEEQTALPTESLPIETPTPSATVLLPTETPIPAATEFPPTATPFPTTTSTPTLIPTPLPPTDTPTPTATSTPTPTPTPTPLPTTPPDFPERENFESSLFSIESKQDKQTLWVAFSTGLRSFEPLTEHYVAIYNHDGTTWQLLSEITLEEPDYINEASITEVYVEPEHNWLAVEGGVGVNGSCYSLLNFNGVSLQEQVIQCGGISQGHLEDLNKDGIADLITDKSDRYVFCGACGVISNQFDFFQWDGTQMTLKGLSPLAESAPAELRNLNDKAVQLAQAELWKDAQTLIKQAQAHPQAETESLITWNAAIINRYAEANAQQVEEGVYPLLATVFYGDYEAAIDIIRPYEPAEIFSQETPLIIGTVAEYYTLNLSGWIKSNAAKAIEAKPDLAAAYFLLGWAIYLEDPQSTEVSLNISKAATLNPNEFLFIESLSYLKQNSN